jgi:hypothetical protein
MNHACLQPVLSPCDVVLEKKHPHPTPLCCCIVLGASCASIRRLWPKPAPNACSNPELQVCLAALKEPYPACL